MLNKNFWTTEGEILEYTIIPDSEFSEKGIIAPINGFPDYFISTTGDVYSWKNKKKGLHKMKPWIDSQGRYLQIGLVDPNGKVQKLLVHRLVAITFIPNPDQLPEVNHKDKNTQNPDVSNLEWCTRRDNLYDSYKTMSPVRNFRTCKLYRDGELVDNFQSIREASRFANKQFGVSFTSMQKYLKCKNCKIERCA